MSELITVKRGFTLEETAPSIFHHSQTDSVTSITRQMIWPAQPDIHTPGHVSDYPKGQFARQWATDHWLAGLDFGLYLDAAQTYAPGGEMYDQSTLQFTRLPGYTVHTVSIRDLAQDPQNPQMHTFDIYDSVLGQIYPQFTAHIGYPPFGSHLPKFGFSAKAVRLYGMRLSDGGLDWIVPTFDISLVYWTNHSWDPEELKRYEVDVPTAYSYANDTNAAVYPQFYEQTDESHVVTETITIDS